MKKTVRWITVVGLTALGASAELIVQDDFERDDYGTTEIALNGESGGSGWVSAWQASSGYVKFDPSIKLSYTATGYINTGLTGDVGGSMGAYNSGALYANRDFSESPISSGVLWVSFLSNRGSVNSSDDRTGLYMRDNENQVLYIGSRADDWGIGAGASAGYPSVDQVDGVFSANDTHLTIVKIDYDNGVSAWLDPTDVSSEAALGTADASATKAEVEISNFDLVSQGHLGIMMQENTDVRQSVDAIRLGTDLSSVVIPEPPALGLFSFATLLIFVTRRVFR